MAGLLEDLENLRISDEQAGSSSLSAPLNQFVPTNPPPKCARCNGPPVIECILCKGVVDPTSDSPMASTWYCSAKCLKEDKSAHLPECKFLVQRHLLYAVAKFLVPFWAIYRRYAFDLEVQEVTYADGVLSIHVPDSEEHKPDKYIMLYPKDCVKKSLAGVKKGSIVERGIRVHGSSEEAIACLNPILNELVKGKDFLIQQYQVRLRNPPLKPKRIIPKGDASSSGDLYYYRVWKVRTNMGDEWAIDPTAPQFGLEAVMSWSMFVGQECVDETKSLEPLRDADHYFDTLVKDLGNGDIQQLYRIEEKRSAAQFFKLFPEYMKMEGFKNVQEYQKKVYAQKTKEWNEACLKVFDRHFTEWYSLYDEHVLEFRRELNLARAKGTLDSGRDKRTKLRVQLHE